MQNSRRAQEVTPSTVARNLPANPKAGKNPARTYGFRPKLQAEATKC